MAYAVTDRVVDLYLEVADQVEDDIDVIEDERLRPQQAHGRIQRIYQLKRELVEFKRAVVPLQRPLAALTARPTGTCRRRSAATSATCRTT